MRPRKNGAAPREVRHPQSRWPLEQPTSVPWPRCYHTFPPLVTACLCIVILETTANARWSQIRGRGSAKRRGALSCLMAGPHLFGLCSGSLPGTRRRGTEVAPPGSCAVAFSRAASGSHPRRKKTRQATRRASPYLYMHRIAANCRPERQCQLGGRNGFPDRTLWPGSIHAFA